MKLPMEKERISQNALLLLKVSTIEYRILQEKTLFRL